jgi:hypothetical protein
LRKWSVSQAVEGFLSMARLTSLGCMGTSSGENSWAATICSAWLTDHFLNYANFGNLSTRAQGSGIVVDLGSVQDVSSVNLVLPFSGQEIEVLAAPASAASAPTGLGGFPDRISNPVTTGTTLDSTPLTVPIRTRFVLVHIILLAADPSHATYYHGGISEIQVLS